MQLIPAEMGNYRDFSDAGGGPLVLGQMEPIEQVSDTRIRSVHAITPVQQIKPTTFDFFCGIFDPVFKEFVAGGTTVLFS